MAEYDFTSVKELIQKQMTERAIPSMAVAVAKDGEIVWEEAFGWADREAMTPATPDTLYSLASISKPYTATGLMILRDRGLLDLDKPIDRYLGDAKLTAHVGKAKDATVRRVANHTSGLGLHYQFFYEDEPHFRPSMDETILRYGHLVTAPGERDQYSNLGYGLLEYVIERLSGCSYQEFMRREVFLPLGMTRSSVHIGDGLEPFAAARYAPEGFRYAFYDFDHRGGSAVYASAHDLARFGMFFLREHLADHKQILSDDTVDEMHTPTSVESDPGYGIGFGVHAKLFDDIVRMVGHTGGMGGVSTAFRLFPSERVAIAVLCNTQDVLPFLVANEVSMTVIPAIAACRKKLEQLLNQPTPKPHRPGADYIGEWKGSIHTYKTEVPIELTFKRSGDVHAKVGNDPATLLSDISSSGNGRIVGKMTADIGTEDAARRPYHVYLDITSRGDSIDGAAIALSKDGGKVGNALSHWVELKRVSKPRASSKSS